MMADHRDSLRNSNSFVSFSSIKSSARRFTTSLSPVKQGALFLPPESESPPRSSIASSSTSSAASPQTPRNGQIAGGSSASFPFYSDAKASLHDLTQHPQPAPLSSPLQSPLKGLRIVDGVWPKVIAPSKNRSSSFPAMIVTPLANSLRPENGKPSQAANISPVPSSGVSTSYGPTPAGNTQTPSTVYQQIQEISSKRISTLGYLRKA